MYAVIKDNVVTGVFSKVPTGTDPAVCFNVDEMGEATLTRVYNFCTGENVTRMRNVAKAEKAISDYVRAQSKKPRVSEEAAIADLARAVQPVDAFATRAESVLADTLPKSIKARVRHVLNAADTALSLDALCALTQGSRATVQTALSDLKSPKYCGDGGPLKIIRNEKKEYQIDNSN